MEQTPPGTPRGAMFHRASDWVISQKMVRALALKNLVHPWARHLLTMPAVPHKGRKRAASAAGPDYTRSEAWAARPYSFSPTTCSGAVDFPVSEHVPDGVPTPPPECERAADLFFLHPTGYFGPLFNQWRPGGAKATGGSDGGNFDLDPGSIAADEQTDFWMLSTQASAFNGSCRVWAPYYRQVSILGLENEDSLSVAYGDCKRAFQYFLSQVEDDAPVVLASHSQGGFHLKRLIEELVDPDPRLRARLVCAYLVGSRLPLSVFGTAFHHVREGRSASETGCVVGWDTLAERCGLLTRHLMTSEPRCLCTNPITWRSGWDADNEGGQKKAMAADGYLGGVEVRLQMGRNLTWRETMGSRPLGDEVKVLGLTTLVRPGFWAKSTDNGLRVPNVPWDETGPLSSVQWLLSGWYHCCDYQFFWHNVRENVRVRVKAWYDKQAANQAGVAAPAVGVGITRHDRVQAKL